VSGYLAWNQALRKDVADHPADVLLRNFLYGGVAVTLHF